ncbi:hypothetical protein TrVE_jg7620 [Triparma verrucosa]|uniref:Uncharacterized protein n=1 Tax=Triparma verrucosa TaxID=1606542 RepID=A0A9W7C8J1_9STRA|nr:hypothetical protein TrVE_jg7620 [Triparma verrucosa]
MYDFPTPAISGFTFPVVCNAKGGERLGNFWIQYVNAQSYSPRIISCINLYIKILKLLAVISVTTVTITYMYYILSWCDIILPNTAYATPKRKGSLVVAGKRNRRTGSESNFWVWSRTLSPSVGFEPTSKKGGRTVFAFD